MSYIFSEEYFNDELIQEISFLTQLSWKETNCSPYADYDPDWEEYTSLNEMNLLRLFTVRSEENELVGYITFLVAPTIHSKGVIHALHDSMYILKQHRKNGTAKNLIEYVEKELKQSNVIMMMITVMTHRDFSPTLKELGFVKADTSYIKRMN